MELENISLSDISNLGTANDKYSLSNSQNLRQPIQMYLSKKLGTFSEFSLPFLQFKLNFEHLRKKMSLIAFILPKSQIAKDLVR